MRTPSSADTLVGAHTLSAWPRPSDCLEFHPQVRSSPEAHTASDCRLPATSGGDSVQGDAGNDTLASAGTG